MDSTWKFEWGGISWWHHWHCHGHWRGVASVIDNEEEDDEKKKKEKDGFVSFKTLG